MATLPPWLDRPNYVGAMQAGAQLGATLRAQDQAAQEHAARLALQQDQINLEEKRLATTAAEALRRHNALEMFKQQQLGLEREKMQALTADREARRQAAAERQAIIDKLNREKFDFTKEKAGQDLDLRERNFNLDKQREERIAQGKTASITDLRETIKQLTEQNPNDPAIAVLAKQLRDKLNIGEFPSKPAQSLLDKYNTAKENVASGNLFWGPDFLRAGTDYTKQLRESESALAGLGMLPKEGQSALPITPATPPKGPTIRYVYKDGKLTQVPVQ